MLRVRVASADDCTTIANLASNLLTEINRDNKTITITQERVRLFIESSIPTVTFLAENDTVPVGFISAVTSSAIYSEKDFGIINELYVEPLSRSEGIAAQLIKALTDHAGNIGWSSLSVGTPHQPQWIRTLNFYKKQGFVEIGPRLRLKLTN